MKEEQENKVSSQSQDNQGQQQQQAQVLQVENLKTSFLGGSSQNKGGSK